MTQTIKLRPMSETPERWPVLLFHKDTTLSRHHGEPISFYSYGTGAFPNKFAGWLYFDELKFEVEE